MARLGPTIGLAARGLAAATALLALVPPAAAQGAPRTADAAYVRVVQIVPGRSLWVRSAPRPSAKRIGFLPHDARHIRSYGCRTSANGSWCSIRYRNTRGWAARRYLRPDLPPRT